MSLEILFNKNQSIYIESILTNLIAYIKENIDFVNKQETSIVVDKVLKEFIITNELENNTINIIEEFNDKTIN
jgi:hypothetical protein